MAQIRGKMQVFRAKKGDIRNLGHFFKRSLKVHFRPNNDKNEKLGYEAKKAFYNGKFWTNEGFVGDCLPHLPRKTAIFSWSGAA